MVLAKAMWYWGMLVQLDKKRQGATIEKHEHVNAFT